MNGNKLLPDDYIPPFNQQDMEQIIETGKRICPLTSLPMPLLEL